MAHAQKPDFTCRRNGRVHFNRRGRQFSRLLAAEVCASGAVMLGTPCSVWRVLATHSIRQFPLHSLSRASPCAITFQLDSDNISLWAALEYRLDFGHYMCVCSVDFSETDLLYPHSFAMFSQQRWWRFILTRCYAFWTGKKRCFGRA